MRVSEVMSRASVTDSESDPLTEAAARMWKQQTGSLLVMSGETLLGIITERDIMKAVARGVDLAATPVSAVMTATVQTVTPQTTVAEAAKHMADRWIRHLPVLEDGRVIGMVSQRDLCGVLSRIDLDSVAPAGDLDGLVRDRRLARVTPAATGSAEPPVLPQASSDEQGTGWGDRPGGADERLLADRPPHWQD